MLLLLLPVTLAAITLPGSGLVSASLADDQDHGACQCAAVDYADAGSYLINADTDGRFTYASRFEGECPDTDTTSVLRDPDGRVYQCSPMRPGSSGSIQLSECGISYRDMKTGTWQIIINLDNAEVKRTFTLTVGAPETVVTTITPTVIIGTTSTPPASTVVATTFEITTLTLRPSTITTPCTAPKTFRTTTRGTPTLVVQTQIVLQISTDRTVTTSATTTSALVASCRYPTSSPGVSSTSQAASSASATRAVTVTVTAAPTAAVTDGYTFTMSGSACVVDWAQAGNDGGWGPPWRGGGGGGWGKGKGKWGGGGGRGGPPDWITSVWQGGVPPWITAGGTLPPWVSCSRTTARPRRALRGGASVAAWTSTVLQTTYTETQVTTSILPAETVTRYVIETAVQTLTPAPSTQCVVAPDVTETVTAPGPRLTQITLVTSTSHVTATVFVTQTILTISNDMAAATSCWQNGGSYGINQP